VRSVLPPGSRFVASLANPGGNITGFTNVEGSLSSKWLGLMREVAPHVSHVRTMFNPQTAPYVAKFYLPAFEAAASSLAMQTRTAVIHNAAEVEAAIADLAHEPDGGLIVVPDTSTIDHRQTIISLADRYRLPTVYPYRFFVADGGLMSYGIDLADSFQSAATYVDRILKGAKPSELAVQLPTKFELTVNLKTAQALGIAFPPTLIARADDVIE
jgi:putative tryptophan/tyrosine transport system substrate-binding protein